jgi:hypothetical protein
MNADFAAKDRTQLGKCLMQSGQNEIVDKRIEPD